MNNLLNQARAAAAQGAAENMTETTKGGGSRVLPEGTALARFTAYTRPLTGSFSSCSSTLERTRLTVTSGI